MTRIIEYRFEHRGLSDYDALIALEDRLEELLPYGCSIDGHEFGDGIMSLFLVTDGTADPNQLVRAQAQMEILEIKAREVREISAGWKPGDVLVAELKNGSRVFGRNLGTDSSVGYVVLVYESTESKPEQLQEIVDLPIIVRALGIHSEVAAEGEWKVIGNLPLTSQERRWKADVPGVLAGYNMPLAAANMHYGLVEEDRQLDDYINPDNHPIPATLYFGRHPFPQQIEDLLLKQRDNEYFLDEIWMEALEWESGNDLERAVEVLTRGRL